MFSTRIVLIFFEYDHFCSHLPFLVRTVENKQTIYSTFLFRKDSKIIVTMRVEF